MLNLIKPAITYGVFERMKTILLKTNDGPLTSIQIFFIGALSKTLATIVTYPYIMAKIRMQWKPPQNISKELNESIRYKSPLDVLSKVYKTEGFKGLYKVAFYLILGYAGTNREGCILPGYSVCIEGKVGHVYLHLL